MQALRRLQGASTELQAYSQVLSHDARGLTTLLKSRAVLRVAGNDALSFLQGLITQDTKLLESPTAPPIYAAMLNAKGRCMYDLVIHREPTDTPSLLLDTAAETAPQLAALLTRFKLRAAVTIVDTSSQLSVVAQFPDPPPACRSSDPARSASVAAATDTAAGAHPAASTSADEGSGRSDTVAGPASESAEAEERSSAEVSTAGDELDLAMDPRLDALGRRGIVAASVARDLGDPGPSEVHAFQEHRYRLGVAESCFEIEKDSAIPLEYNMDALNGIAYEKGCYMGQELVARTHFQGLIRKRVVPISIPGEYLPDMLMDDTVWFGTDTNNLKSCGKLKGVSGRHGIALLRLKQVRDVLDGKAGMWLVDDDRHGFVPVIPSIPDWWLPSFVSTAD